LISLPTRVCARDAQPRSKLLTLFPHGGGSTTESDSQHFPIPAGIVARNSTRKQKNARAAVLSARAQPIQHKTLEKQAKISEMNLQPTLD
jgi:hypothetical protein